MLIAAPVMGLAVAGMHYTAMRAAVFLPTDTLPPLGLVLPATLMALWIAFVALLMAAIAFSGSIAGRQTELAAGLRVEISERKNAEAALVRAREHAEAAEHRAESERARLQAIFDAVVDAIVTIDKDGCITDWSSSAQRIFGYAPAEIIGQNLTILMPEPHRSRHAAYVGSFLKTRDAKIIGIGRELTAIRKDGIEFPIELGSAKSTVATRFSSPAFFAISPNASAPRLSWSVHARKPKRPILRNPNSSRR
jgi:two-component system, sensor histidine kinase and response regulator